jgi:putative Holliday junction resolvase
MKYLGIDFGSKKVGFAQSDDDARMAFPLMIAENDASLLKDTVEMVRELKITTVVIGESVDQKGKPNEIAKKARGFAAKLEDAIDVRIVFEKEWFTTVEARKQPGREGDHEVDDSAAALLLQRYLDKSNGPSLGRDEVFETDDDEAETADTDKDAW